MTDTAPRFDPAQPLAAIDRETATAHRALLDYWELGPERSYPKLADIYAGRNRGEYREQLPGRTPPTRSKNAITAQKIIEAWGSSHQWQARIKAQNTIDQQRLQEIMIERRATVLAQQYEMSQEMIELGREGLRQGAQFTSTSRRFIKGKDGQPDREIITVRMDGRAVVQMAETGIKLARDATGLDDKAAGTEADPIHTVTESREEWERRAAERAAAAAATLAEFADEPDGAK